MKAKVGGSVNLNIFINLGTALNLTSMEDNKNSVAIRWQKQPPLKTSFSLIFKIKSSSTWLISASLCEGPFFYFYVESSSSTFMHQLREHSCHSECNVHSPRIIIDWLILLVLLVLKLLVSSHPLNSKGVLAFMFCSTIGDKLNTTFLCFICSNKHVLSMLSIHCHCLSTFHD